MLYFTFYKKTLIKKSFKPKIYKFLLFAIFSWKTSFLSLNFDFDNFSPLYQVFICSIYILLQLCQF